MDSKPDGFEVPSDPEEEGKVRFADLGSRLLLPFDLLFLSSFSLMNILSFYRLLLSQNHLLAAYGLPSRNPFAVYFEN